MLDPAESAALIRAYRESILKAGENFRVKFNEANSPSEDIKKFTISALIGQGGFGAIYRAEKDGKKYAIKQLPKAKYREAKKQDKVVLERKICHALRNEFIVELHCKDKDQENLYLMLEYTPLCDLENMISRMDFPENRALKILSQVVLGVEYMHACGVIYCDLKPGNILFFPGGRMKLTDFGLSQLATMTNNVRSGTASYMAPELVEHKLYSDAVDWWALGITMFKMLLKAHPFGSFATPKKWMYDNILTMEIQGLDEADISDAAKSLLRRLLEKDHTKRLGTLREGVEAVRSHAWFKDVDIDGLILPTVVFKNEICDNIEEKHQAADPNVFKKIGPNDRDPLHEEFADF